MGLSVQTKIAIICGLFAVAMVGLFFVSPIPQDPSYHAFADKRTIFGSANFGDTFSNAGFLLVGLWGLFQFIGSGRKALFDERADAVPYIIFFFGITMISLGSGFYHSSPNNQALFWDRLPMTIAFMAFFAAVIADRINKRAGIIWLLPLFLVAGVVSLLYWRQTEGAGHGDLRFYGMVQFYPIVAIPVIIWLFPAHRYTRGQSIAWLIFWFGASKLAEQFDKQIFDLLGGAVSGHSIKHFLSAIAVYVIVGMLRRSRFEHQALE